jgi:sensor histidine kinase YesM
MKIKGILLHIVIWGCWIALLLYFYSINNTIYFWDQVLFHGANITIFYFFWGYFMPALTKGQRVYLTIVKILFFVFLFYIFKYFTDYKYVKYIDIENVWRKFTIRGLLQDVTPVFVANSSMGIVSFYIKEYFLKRRILAIAEQEKIKLLESNLQLVEEKLLLQQTNLLLEKKQIETENAYLRAQINPHFLHNTLNFFFSKSINVGAFDLADAIMVLSNVMRFSLEAKPDENGRVEVAQEMEHMKNVIKINEIRFNKTYCLDLKIEGDMETAKIIPLVLITMVENAFKYGELFDPENPLKIHITIADNRFRFYLHNKKRTGGAQEASHGIGVVNSIKRLTAAYGADGYAIDIEQDAVFYSVTLTIFDLTRVEQVAFSEMASTPVINKQPINELT